MIAHPGHNPRVVLLRDEREVREALATLGAHRDGIEIMAPKFIARCLKLTGVSLRAAILVKQEMLARGGEAAVCKEVAALTAEATDMLLFGTEAQYDALVRKLSRQPFGLKALADEIAATLSGFARGSATGRALVCRDKVLPLGTKTYVMGILNITPDSFSDGGTHLELDRALAGARRMVADGADIIDVGGESTRPGAFPVPIYGEMARVIPVVRELVLELDVPISIDTTKAHVALAALEAGAHIVNDISGFRAEPEIAAVAARYKAGAILMHRRGDPRTMQENPAYQDLIGEILAYLRESVAAATEAGLSPDNLAIDPGIGFGKNLEHNLEILRRMAEFTVLGLPVLVGTSRKSLIGKVLDLEVDQRLEGTAATVALAIAGGADLVRVHDVKEMARVARMTDAVVRRI